MFPPETIARPQDVPPKRALALIDRNDIYLQYGTVVKKISLRAAQSLERAVIQTPTLNIPLARARSGAEGKYRDPTGSINAEFKDGKAYIALGVYAVDGTYTIEGNKIIAKGDFGPVIPSPCVFTINKDGTIDGPRNSLIRRLEKVK